MMCVIESMFEYIYLLNTQKYFEYTSQFPTVTYNKINKPYKYKLILNEN